MNLKARLNALEVSLSPRPSWRVLFHPPGIDGNPEACAAWLAQQPPAPRGCLTIIIRNFSKLEEEADGVQST
ncbi:hypothetical protein GLI01_23540 [Gluconacetobacter liquefaciens]|uniref:Uncharacterized protein n=1 Tax=Gluconacetobacter liquefaciens TaxID=89584 RepID=A0A370G2T6_GLULI|nr:hypothetical protein [Gluconacetobacter liquefaciens]RDI38148.1 hypothetical protein C7453_10485 [Gluconacetobacter liquefaciens]GBR09444.1 hypothetical protein AA0522_2329 [Gluconacetobacter liquefaciens NRIC 0522]GEB38319.1 hypothetical protein GLI01_23540 [Gluconacetobacter liquefaciens]